MDKKNIKKPIKSDFFEVLEAAVRFWKLKRSGMKAIITSHRQREETNKKGALTKEQRSRKLSVEGHRNLRSIHDI